MKTLGEFIKDLQDLAKEHGEELPVIDAEGDEVFAEYQEDEEEEGPVIVIG